MLLVILALLVVGAGLWWWNQQRQHRAEMEARDQLKQLEAIVQLNSSQKHVGTLMVRKELAKALPWIGQLPYLTHLDVADTGLTDSDLDQIAGLPRLYSLDASNTQLTDDGVAKLTGVPLETIFLAGTKITGESLNQLAQIKSLKIVGLAGTAVQDNVAALTKLPKLEWIVLDDVDLSKIDQQTLDSLAQMPMLGRLSVLRTNIPEDALKRLLSAKPALKIDSGSAVKTVNPGAGPANASAARANPGAAPAAAESEGVDQGTEPADDGQPAESSSAADGKPAGN
ncbi:MAG: hypothetical protein U0795_01850 [Pirellulales bacterium]